MFVKKRPEIDRRVPTQERARRRVARILDAAALVFAEQGFEAATMEDIAARAETSIGSIYQFFPNKLAIFDDIDTVLLMEDSFDLADLTGEAALIFQHMEADAHFGASVFWTKRSGALGGEQAMLEYWQGRREGGRRGIVEIVGEPS